MNYIVKVGDYVQKSLIDGLFQRRIDDLVGYAHIILMSLYDAKSDNKEKIRWSISTYYENFIFDNNDDELSKYEVFYKDYAVDGIIEKRFIYVIMERLVGDKKVSSKVIEDLVMLAKVLSASIEIENKMVNISGKNKNFTETMNLLKEKYGIFDGNKWNDVRNIRKKLRQNISKNKKYANKIHKEILKDEFNLDFYQMYPLDEDDGLIIRTTFNYNKEELSNFDDRLIKIVYDKNNFILEHTLIQIQKVLLYNYQWMTVNGQNAPIIIELDSKIFDKKANINKIIKICQDDRFTKNIVFKINPLLLDDKIEFIQFLIEAGYKFAINDFKFVDQNTGIVENNVKYVILAAEDLETNLKVSSLRQDVGMVFVDIEKENVPLLMSL